MASPKQRLDTALVERGFAQSRERARALIMAGKVLVNELRIEKPASRVDDSDVIRLKGADVAYVSRGGLKLEAALEEFKVDPTGFICLDVGASTGGFTDCLLQHGARHVFAVDVGYGQLAWQLRQDPRVTLIERTNIRHMPYAAINRTVDLICIDVSFISLRIVIPAVMAFMQSGTLILALIKPQFEVGRQNVGKGGVVKDPDLHRQVIAGLTCELQSIGLKIQKVIPSPVLGPKGNREFLALISRSESGRQDP